LQRLNINYIIIIFLSVYAPYAQLTLSAYYHVCLIIVVPLTLMGGVTNIVNSDPQWSELILVSWIQIRIRIQLHESKSEDIQCFEVLYVLF
jgi:hypothetical protein